MTEENLLEIIKAQLPYEPNFQQLQLLEALARFTYVLGERNNAELSHQPSADRVFVINGYAGTGKTSLISALVRALKSLKINVVLMAPTGRAAKVFSGYSGFPASTIHRRVYRHSLHGEVPGLKENKDCDTLYIVDEASMIGSASLSGGYGPDLLHDMLTYVYSGLNNRLILMGDTAQLPPVGDMESPAMDSDFLRELGLKVSRATLTKVARQSERSGILANAVHIRREMTLNPGTVPVPIVKGFEDVRLVPPSELFEVMDTAYRNHGIEDTLVITRSNGRAADFNRAIRREVLYYEEQLVAGEPLMIVKNNYFWTKQSKRRDIDFLANGDIVRVVEVLGTEYKYGFWWTDIEIEPVLPYSSESNDTGEATEKPDKSNPFVVKIMQETLGSDSAALKPERMQTLYQNIVRTQYADVVDINKALAQDPYWNALQTKYAYCVTCHKAQGGQWRNVIVDIAYINPDAIGPELYRWMYTATTRARKNLYYLTSFEN